MAVETWLLFLLVSIAPVISPGPGILLTIGNALRYGARTAIISGFVNGVGVCVLCLAVGFGLGALMEASAVGFIALKLFGAGYLIWVGVKIWRRPWALVTDEASAVEKPELWRIVRQALLIALTNPKALILIAALLPPFMDASRPATPQVLIMSISYSVLCFGAHCLIACAGGWLRRRLSRPQWAKIFRRSVGGAFIGFGAAMALRP
ncbi:MAG: LysE family translocator [Neomegalonema sp.]|nr:LysE family translocator [Neomegalonema sp.]